MKVVHTVEVTDGPDAGLSVELTGKATVVGRGADCDLRLNDPELSRRHFKLSAKGGKAEAEDLGSTNGTFLNGKPLEKSGLGDGDYISAGNSKLRYTVSEAGKEPAEKPKNADKAPVSLAARARGLGWSRKVLGLFLALAVVAQLLVAWPLLSQRNDAVEKEALRRASVLVLTLAALNRQALDLGDALLIDVKPVAAKEGVAEVYIYDRAGRTLAPVSQLNQPPRDDFGQKAVKAESLFIAESGNGVYQLAQPIRVFNRDTGKFYKVGTARLVFSLKKLRQDEESALGSTLISFIVLLAVSVFLALFLIRFTVRPIEKLRLDVEAAMKGDQDQVAAPGFSALDGLAGSVNRLLAKMKTGGGVSPAEAPSAPIAKAVNEARAAVSGRPLGPRLEALVRVVGHAVVVVDASNQVLSANQAFCEQMKLDMSGVLGKHLLEVISDPVLLAASLELIREASAAQGGAVSRQAADSRGDPVELSVSVLADVDGEIGFIALAMRPVGAES